MEFQTNDELESEPSTSSAFALAFENATEAEIENPMAFDVNNTDANGCGVNDQPSPEFLQRKLYFLLEHLKKMHGELPE